MSAWERGYDAAASHASRDDCPYLRGTDEAYDWQQGYGTRREEMAE